MTTARHNLFTKLLLTVPLLRCAFWRAVPAERRHTSSKFGKANSERVVCSRDNV